MHASAVPAKFACSEFHRSPWIKSEKLVVMPHDGQGNPVISLNVHLGKFNGGCVCVSAVRGRPLASYGSSSAAMTNTVTHTLARPRRISRPQIGNRCRTGRQGSSTT